jgi:hypothetical protein
VPLLIEHHAQHISVVDLRLHITTATLGQMNDCFPVSICEYATALTCLSERYAQKAASWRELYCCLCEKYAQLEERYEEALAVNFQLENDIADKVKTIHRKDAFIELFQKEIDTLKAYEASETLIAMSQEGDKDSKHVGLEPAS